jgi:hypothetical protein
MGSNHQLAIGFSQSTTAVFRDSEYCAQMLRASSERHQVSPFRCVKVLATTMTPEKKGRASCIGL